jgi:putative ABC transport system permease protein
VENFISDVRSAIRTLAKDHRSTLPSIFALTLGISAATVVFGVVYNVLLNPFPYRASHRLITFTVENLTKSQGITHRDWFGPQEFLALRDQNRVFEDIVGYDPGSFFYDDGKGTRQLEGSYVTPNTFVFYGVPPLLGRGLTSGDAEPGAAPVFLMSYGLWQREFGGDPKILGTSFLMNDEPRVLVGVMPKRFNIYNSDVWLSRSSAATDVLTVVGRLKSGTDIRSASADLLVISHRLLPNESKCTVSVRTLIEGKLGDFRKMFHALLAAVFMLLLIACGNVANLLLARATARSKEISIRTALGATRARLLRQLLVESFLLSLIGCVAGCGFAYFGLKGMAAIIPPNNIPREAVLGFNPVVLLFALGVALITTVACGIAPAYHAMSFNVQQGLADNPKSSTGSHRHGKFRAGLIIAEVALSIVLLIGGTLMMRSFLDLKGIDLPFNPANILYIKLSFPKKIYYAQPDRKPEFFRKVLPRIQELPGVISVAETWKLPPNAWAQSSDIAVFGDPDHTWQSQFELCTEGYFRTLGLSAVKGRLLSESDLGSAGAVAVVNETFARQVFGGQEAVGRKIKFQVFDRTFLDAPHNTYFEIVGVVPDFWRRPEGTKYTILPEAFVPASVVGFANPLYIIAKTATDPHLLLKEAYQEIWAVDPRVTFTASGSIKDFLKDEDRVPQFDTITLSSFAGIGLLLVGIGIFSVMTYDVSLQTNEIGIRMALGARQGAILRMVLRKGLSLITLGAIVGLCLGFGLARYLASQLWGISAGDPWTVVAVVLLIFVAGTGACFLPAWRAAHLDPLIAFRYQ